MLPARQHASRLALGLLLGLWYAPALAQTTGCGLPAAPGVSTVTRWVNGVQRSSVCSVPSNDTPTIPSRLVFAWHGRGGSGQPRRSQHVEDGLSGIAVYPKALLGPQCGGHTCWDLDPMGHDIALSDARLAHLAAQGCLHPPRLVDDGCAFGGAMTHRPACGRHRATRAVAVDAGWLPEAGYDGPVRDWAEHADDAQAGPITAGRAATAWWRSMESCSAATTPVWPTPCVAATGWQSGVAVTGYTRPQGGHPWSPWTSQAIAACLSQDSGGPEPWAVEGASCRWSTRASMEGTLW
jgi:poly(3-hydroxybutyrate) depolymerase